MNTNTGTNVTSPMFAAFKAETRISFIRPFDPKQCINVPDYRHAVLRYRQTDKNVASKPAKMVTVPSVVLPADLFSMPEKARKVLTGVIEDQQDAILKALNDSGVSMIEWDSISLDNCLDALTAIQTSQRLTKEQIENWIMVSMIDLLRKRGVQIAESKNFAAGSDDYTKQIAVIINNYRGKFGNLAAPVPNLAQNEAQALQNMLTTSQLDDDIARSLKKKLHAILNPEAVSDEL